MAAKKKPAKKRLGLPTRKDPVRLQKWLANPGLRSKLDDSLLSPEQRKQREIARDPYYKTVQSLATQKYGGAIGELQGAQRVSDQAQRNVSDWFGQYQRELAASRDRQQALQQQAAGDVAARAQSMVDMSAGVNQGLQNAASADAAVRGAQVGAEPARAGADANSVRGALGQLAANTLTTQGVSNNSAMEGLLAAAVGEAALAKQREQGNRSDIDRQLRELLRERDAFKVSARGDLVDADRKAELEAKAFGLDVSKVVAQRRDQEQRRIETRRSNRSREEIARRNAETARINATKPKAPKKGKPKSGLGSRTKADVQSFVKDINAATKAIQGGTKRTEILNAPGGRTPAERKAIANAANDMAKLGYLSPANVRALRAIGVNVGGFPRSKEQARKAGTLPAQQVGQVLEGIGGAVGGLLTKPAEDK